MTSPFRPLVSGAGRRSRSSRSTRARPTASRRHRNCRSLVVASPDHDHHSGLRRVRPNVHAVKPASPVSRVPRTDPLHLWRAEANEVTSLRPMSDRKRHREWQLARGPHATQGRLRDGLRAGPSAGWLQPLRLRAHPRRRGTARSSPGGRRDGSPSQRRTARQPAGEPRTMDAATAVRHTRLRRCRVGARDPCSV